VKGVSNAIRDGGLSVALIRLSSSITGQISAAIAGMVAEFTLALKLMEMITGQDAEPFAYDQLDNVEILGI
jgi:hypothetical protein